MTKIINCRVENILGAKKIEFAPNGKSITVGGANGSGKSSALTGLVAALAGKSHIPGQPVTIGKDAGSIVVELDDYIVKLDIGSDRKTKLRLESKDGAAFASPQARLNELFGPLSFDPGLFKGMDDFKRTKTLMDLVGLDFGELEVEYNKKYSERTQVNTLVKNAEGMLAGRKISEDVGFEEVSVSELAHELTIAQAENRKNSQMLDAIQINALRRKNCLDRIAELKQECNVILKEGVDLTQQHKAMPRHDCDSMIEKISMAEEMNKLVRGNIEIRTKRAAIESHKKQSNDITAELDAVKVKKKEQLKSANYPIDGLSFADGNVTYHDIPYSQLSESEQWEVSLAIGFTLNPKGILFMRNSGGLDKKSRERVRARAAERDVQLFLEVVDDASDVQILIEEGMVKENRLTGEAKDGA